MKKNKKKSNNILSIILTIIKLCLFVFLLAILIVIFIQRVFDNMNISLGGIRMFNVASSSMYPEYEIGDILVTKEAEPKEINVGDNVTYLGKKYDFDGLIVTHKVIEKIEKNDKYYFVTKGIANEVEDPAIEYSQVYGKVVYKTKFLSYISKLMNKKWAYYLIFTIIGVITSIEFAGDAIKKKIATEDISDEEDR